MVWLCLKVWTSSLNLSQGRFVFTIFSIWPQILSLASVILTMIIVVLLKYCPLVMLAMIIVVGSQFDISSLLPAQTGSDSCPNSFPFRLFMSFWICLCVLVSLYLRFFCICICSSLQFDISTLPSGSDSCPNSFSFEAAKRENGQIRRQKDVIWRGRQEMVRDGKMPVITKSQICHWLNCNWRQHWGVQKDNKWDFS